MRTLPNNVKCHFNRHLIYNGYYVYIFCDSKAIPFYVGKGTKDRWRHHFYSSYLSRKHPKSAKINKLLKNNEDIHIYVDMFSETNSEKCYEREIELISKYGRKCDGGTLTNLTEGGGQDYTWRDYYTEQDFLDWRRSVAENNGWTNPDLIKKAKLLYHYRGMTGGQITELDEFKGISPWTVRQWVCKNNPNYDYIMPHLKDKTELIEEKTEEAKNLYLNSQFTKHQVADILGLSHSFVVRNLTGIFREEQSAGGTS